MKNNMKFQFVFLYFFLFLSTFVLLVKSNILKQVDSNFFPTECLCGLSTNSYRTSILESYQSYTNASEITTVYKSRSIIKICLIIFFLNK